MGSSHDFSLSFICRTTSSRLRAFYMIASCPSPIYINQSIIWGVFIFTSKDDHFTLASKRRIILNEMVGRTAIGLIGRRKYPIRQGVALKQPKMTKTIYIIEYIITTDLQCTLIITDPSHDKHSFRGSKLFTIYRCHDI